MGRFKCSLASRGCHGRAQAIIDLNSQTKKTFTDNSIAADHYHHYKEDVALMKEC